jgi:hypothetical protein
MNERVNTEHDGLLHSTQYGPINADTGEAQTDEEAEQERLQAESQRAFELGLNQDKVEWDGEQPLFDSVTEKGTKSEDGPQHDQQGAPSFDVSDDTLDTGIPQLPARRQRRKHILKSKEEPMTRAEWRQMQLDPESTYNKLLQKRAKRAGRVFIHSTEDDFEPLPDNMLRRRFQLAKFEVKVHPLAAEDEFEVTVPKTPDKKTSPEEVCALIRLNPQWRVVDGRDWRDKGSIVWVDMPGPLYFWIRAHPKKQIGLWKQVEEATKEPSFKAGEWTPLLKLKGAVTFILEPKISRRRVSPPARRQRTRSATAAKVNNADAYALKVGPLIDEMRKMGFNWSVIARDLTTRRVKTPRKTLTWTVEQVQRAHERFSKITAKLGGR